jgi:hypothetical protein
MRRQGQALIQTIVARKGFPLLTLQTESRMQRLVLRSFITKFSKEMLSLVVWKYGYPMALC